MSPLMFSKLKGKCEIFYLRINEMTERERGREERRRIERVIYLLSYT